MTTGRINQVTTSFLFGWPRSADVPFSTKGVFIQWFVSGAYSSQQRVTPIVKSTTQHALFLDLTSFKHISPCPGKETRALWPSKKTTYERRSARPAQTRWLFKWLVTHSFSYQQAIHTLQIDCGHNKCPSTRNGLLSSFKFQVSST